MLIVKFLYPTLTPAQAASIVIPHEAPAAELDEDRPGRVPDGTAK